MTFSDFIRRNKSELPCDEQVAEYEIISVLCHITGLSRTELLLSSENMIEESVLTEANTLLERLMKNEPLGYVLGEVPFCGELFSVEPGVLVPRPETEELVDLAMSRLSQMNVESGSVFECGAGSGVIGLSLAKRLHGFDVHAWDVSPVSQRVVEKNKHRLNVDNYTFYLDDFLAIPESRFLAISGPRILVSNPPYISKDEMLRLDPSVFKYEPPEALTDDGDGLAFYRHFASLSDVFDLMVFECGELQAASIVDIFCSDNQCDVVNDMFGKSRFVVVTKR